MKRIILLGLLLFISSCYNLSFDPTEYDRFITIQELATRAKIDCNDTNLVKTEIDQLNKLVNHQVLYTNYRSAKREEIANSTNELQNIINKLYKTYNENKANKTYCEEKLNIIIDSTSTILTVLGKF